MRRRKAYNAPLASSMTVSPTRRFFRLVIPDFCHRPILQILVCHATNPEIVDQNNFVGQHFWVGCNLKHVRLAKFLG